MMDHTGIHENLKTRLQPEQMTTMTKPENIMVKPNEENCAYKKFYGQISEYTKKSRNFGKMGVVHSIVNVNLEYLGITCILLGYSQNHTTGTYHVKYTHKKYHAKL